MTTGETPLQQVRRLRGWDCLSPEPRKDLLHDLPWLARELEELEQKLSARPEEGERLDAARYRHIKAKESSFIVMYYGSRILGGDKSRRQVLTPELDGLIDSEMNNL